jgi:hypothetical protein
MSEPRIIGLAGVERAGRRTISDFLRPRHFTIARLQAPIIDAACALYGITWWDALYAKDVMVEHLGKTPRQLIAEVALHVDPRILRARLVQRLEQRRAWGRADIVIVDIAQPHEIEWVREMGGCMW